MKLLPALLSAVLLTGCSSVARLNDVTNLVDYSNHKSVKVLEIPSDLDAPKFNRTYITSISDDLKVAKSVGLDQVPLIDKTMAPPPVNSVKIVQKGAQVILQLDDSVALAWVRINDTLKGMGMTVAGANQASGVIIARDRSLVADAGSPIGRLLNSSFGKVNKGAEYKFTVSREENVTSVKVANKAGKALSSRDARLMLARLRKAYTSK